MIILLSMMNTFMITAADTSLAGYYRGCQTIGKNKNRGIRSTLKHTSGGEHGTGNEKLCGFPVGNIPIAVQVSQWNRAAGLPGVSAINATLPGRPLIILDKTLSIR
jgi:hypothetical protein